MAVNCHGGELTRDGVRAKFRRAQGRRPRPEGSELILARDGASVAALVGCSATGRRAHGRAEGAMRWSKQRQWRRRLGLVGGESRA
jgi:hypothetical protein